MVLPGSGPSRKSRTVHSTCFTAVGQCRKVVRAKLWKQVVARHRQAPAPGYRFEQQRRTMAVCAPRLAEDQSSMGLNILRTNVKDTETNVTRFVVVCRVSGQKFRHAGGR